MKNRNEEIAKEIIALALILQEDQIDLNFVAKDKILGGKEINDCYAYLRINGNPFSSLDRPLGVIDVFPASAPNLYEPFIVLYEKANLATQDDPDKIGYITALAIYFGLDENDNWNLLYQPVGLVRFKDTVNNWGEYQTRFYGKKYLFNKNAGNFEVANNWKVTANYESAIGIKHDEQSTTFDSHRPGDAECVIMPFQEIFNLIKHNNATEITIYSAIQNGAGKIFHSLIIAPNGVNPPNAIMALELSNELKAKYANLGQLCPPNCDRIGIKLNS